MDLHTEDTSTPLDAGIAFKQVVQTMARLRSPDGCPWDREQDFDTIRSYTLEETYEVFDAIERRNWPDLKEELGDLLLQVLFYSQMADEAGHFSIAEVIDGLDRKLIRRHPHVFGKSASGAAGNSVEGLSVDGIDADQVLQNWDKIKRAEKAVASHAESRLDEIPRTMPALMEASKIGSRAAKSGFDWPDIEGLFAKMSEETAELREAIEEQKTATDDKAARAAIEGELGDLLFTAVNLARRLKVDPEMALKGSNAKFRRRFAAMEAISSEPIEALDLPALDVLWTQAKQLDDRRGNPPAI